MIKKYNEFVNEAKLNTELKVFGEKEIASTIKKGEKNNIDFSSIIGNIFKDFKKDRDGDYNGAEGNFRKGDNSEIIRFISYHYGEELKANKVKLAHVDGANCRMLLYGTGGGIAQVYYVPGRWDQLLIVILKNTKQVNVKDWLLFDGLDTIKKNLETFYSDLYNNLLKRGVDVGGSYVSFRNSGHLYFQEGDKWSGNRNVINISSDAFANRDFKCSMYEVKNEVMKQIKEQVKKCRNNTLINNVYSYLGLDTQYEYNNHISIIMTVSGAGSKVADSYN